MKTIQRSVCVLALVGLALPLSFQAAAREEKFEAYAEYRRGDVLIVDGQRLKAAAKLKFKGDSRARDFATVPLGYEVSGKGTRQADGSLLVTELTAKPNGTASYENDVRQATNDMEAQWLRAGKVTQPGPDGRTIDVGRLLTSGPQVDRVRAITARLVPPYLNVTDFRVYVLENKEWNAFACANGMIVVHDALLNATRDDELAIILGHELVHTTHEHSRKQIASARSPWKLALGVAAGVAGGEAGKLAQGIAVATAVTYSALQNGYSRDHEDQADRAGLRYAHEGGFDVREGPKLWKRFAEKYGSQDAVSNFFFGSHSRAEARAKNLTREIEINYPTAADSR
jgi:Zn-dependent protease with chaperone function